MKGTRIRTIASLARFENGYPFKPGDFSDSGVPVVRIRQLLDPSAAMDRYDGVVPKAHHLDSGDLVFSWSGSLSVRRWDRGPAYLNQHLFRVLPAPGVDAAWLRYALEWSISAFEGLMHGSAMTHLTRPMMKEVRVGVPTLDEQRRIADFLDDQVARIDAALAARTKQRALLSSSWASQVDEALTAAGGDVTRLSHVARVQSGLTVNDAEQRSAADGRVVPYLSVSNVKDGYLDLAVVKEATVTAAQAARHLLRDGDVLMTEGGDLDKLGRGTVWQGEIAPCLHQNHVFAVRPDRNRLDPWFLTFQTQSASARTYFMLTASKSTNLASTSAGKVLAWPVSVPPLSAQEEVARGLRQRRTDLDAAMADLARSIDLLTEYKQSLITAAVSGDIDVTTASGISVP